MGFSMKSITKPLTKVTKGISGIFDPVADIVGSGLNSLTGVNASMDKSYAQQKAIMDAQNVFDQKMWNLQNQYNTPAAQLARMADAGIDINPTSYALGTGNLSNTAGLVTSQSGFSGSGSPAGNPVSMLIGVAQGVQGLKNAKADLKLKELTGEALQHDLGIAKDTKMPVHQVPGMDTAAGNVLNRVLTFGPKSAYDYLTRSSTKSDTNYFRKASEWIGDKIYQWSH